MLGCLIVSILSENRDIASAGGLILFVCMVLPCCLTYLVAFGYCNGKKSTAMLQFHYCATLKICRLYVVDFLLFLQLYLGYSVSTDLNVTMEMGLFVCQQNV